jgi:hypothetical protein
LSSPAGTMSPHWVAVVVVTVTAVTVVLDAVGE